MALAIGHRDKAGRVAIDHVYGRKAPFDPAAVTREFAEIMKQRWGVRQATCDNYGAEWVVTAFAAHGIKIVPSELSKSDTYLEVEPLFAQGTIDIPQHKTLMAELRDLERRTHRGGRDSIDHPSSQNFHDDHANALALAAWIASAAKQPLVIGPGAMAWARGSFASTGARQIDPMAVDSYEIWRRR
jgi:hypothetical protein